MASAEGAGGGGEGESLRLVRVTRTVTPIASAGVAETDSVPRSTAMTGDTVRDRQRRLDIRADRLGIERRVQVDRIARTRADATFDDPRIAARQAPCRRARCVGAPRDDDR
jgi:hypothetical protein